MDRHVRARESLERDIRHRLIVLDYDQLLAVDKMLSYVESRRSDSGDLTDDFTDEEPTAPVAARLPSGAEDLIWDLGGEA